MDEKLKAISDRVTWTKQVTTVAISIVSLCEYIEMLEDRFVILTTAVGDAQARIEKLERTKANAGTIKKLEKRVKKLEGFKEAYDEGQATKEK